MNLNKLKAVTKCCIIILALFIIFSSSGCSGNSARNAIPDAPVDLTPTDQLTLDLPGYQYLSSIYTKAVRKFEITYPDVTVTVNEIGDSDNDPSDQYQTVITNELMAGAGPDVILTDYFLDLYKTMDTGAFLNLSSIITGDTDFNMNDYNVAVMAAGNYKNGQYIMPIGYQPPLMILIKSQPESAMFDVTKPININDFVKIGAANPLPADYEAFVIHINMPMLGKPTPKDLSFCPYLLNMSGICLINPETKAVLPDEAALRDFCEAYKPFWETYHGDNRELSYHDINRAHILQYATNIESQVSSYDYGANSVFNIQTYDGGVAAVANRGVAINANSKNQLNAWNFIKILLSDTIQIYMTSVTLAEYSDADPVNNAVINSSSDKWLSGAESVEDQQPLIEKLNAVTSCTLPTPRLTDFFMHSITPYFNGDKSLDDCINDLRGKINMYASE